MQIENLLGRTCIQNNDKTLNKKLLKCVMRQQMRNEFSDTCIYRLCPVYNSIHKTHIYLGLSVRTKQQLQGEILFLYICETR